jgi:hypothetical protein
MKRITEQGTRGPLRPPVRKPGVKLAPAILRARLAHHGANAGRCSHRERHDDQGKAAIGTATG